MLATQFAKLQFFIAEREAIRLRKLARTPRPWTRDPVLATYRFCNVNREHDPVTQWIAYHLRPRADAWFALVVGRLLNQPSTLARLYSGDRPMYGWDRTAWLAATDPGHGRIFNAAYIVSTNGVSMPKNQYLADRVLAPLWAARHTRPDALADCAEWATWLMTHNGISDFIANQVVTDYKYAFLKDAPDWDTFVLAGPGTCRGLNRLHGRPTRQSVKRTQAITELLAVRAALVARGKATHMRDLNNLSNCFCEWDKWMRVETSEGTPKQRYAP